MKQAYFIRILDYGEISPLIIDEKAMDEAERGKNYLNPDEFMFLCDADSMQDAAYYYAQENGDNYMCRMLDC